MLKTSNINKYHLNSMIKYISFNQNNPKYFFTMTEINKIGINPKSIYNTPVAICAYPLTNEYFNKILENTLEFAKNQTHIQVFSIKDKLNVISEYKESNFNYDMSKLKKIVDNNILNNLIVNYKFESPFKSLYLITYELSNKNIIKWNSILRSIGYTNFYDNGTGTLHKMNPTQLMVFDPTIINQEDSFYNPNSSNKEISLNKIDPINDDISNETNIKKIYNLTKNTNDFETLKLITLNKNINFAIKELILNKLIYNEELKFKFSQDKDTAKFILDELIEDEDPYIISNIARVCSEDILLKLIQSNHPIILEILKRSDLSNTIINKILEQDLSEEEKILLARKPNLNNFAIINLATDDSDVVRYEIISRKDLPKHIVELLQNDSDPIISSIAKTRFKKLNAFYIKNLINKYG